MDGEAAPRALIRALRHTGFRRSVQDRRRLFACSAHCRSDPADRAHAGHLVKVEVEVDGLDQLEDALQYGPDVVMLDNFSLADLRAAVALTCAPPPPPSTDAPAAG